MTGNLNILAQTTTMPTVAPEPGTFWLPPQASSTAPEVDAVFYFILWVSVFFFALICVLMVWFAVRYRRATPGQPAASRVTHNTPLEITWTAIPLVLVVVMFWMAFTAYMNAFKPPANSMDIRVLAYKWAWLFTYPNGHTDNELHVPVDKPVRLILESNDVIHSLYIPAFRIKRDAVPGRYNKVWFEANKPGDYLLLCAEYCGTQHSDMLARVVVHKSGRFEQWLEDASDPFKTRTMAEVGALLVTKRCASCHSSDGTAMPGGGPSFKGIYEHDAKLADGSTVLVDDNYIRESILYPARKIVAGYGNIMPSFKGQLDDREITAIVEYIKSLSEKDESPSN